MNAPTLFMFIESYILHFPFQCLFVEPHDHTNVKMQKIQSDKTYILHFKVDMVTKVYILHFNPHMNMMVYIVHGGLHGS